MGPRPLLPREVSTPQRRFPFGSHAEDLDWSNSLDIMDSRCCGLEVHAKTGVACRGGEGEKPSRTFSTMTAALMALADWLWAAGGPPIARKRPGVYGRPGFKLREDHVTVLLVKAHPIQAVPGRKPAVRDCAWMGDLRRHGLLKGSVMPPRPIREWRALTRHRQRVVRERAAVAHRSQTRLDSAHRKRGHVAPHGLGFSASFMLQALADGEEAAAPLAPRAQGTLKAQAAPRTQSLTGHLSPPPRVLRQALLRPDDPRDEATARTPTAMHRPRHERPAPCLPHAIALLHTIPGVGARVAETVGSAIGTALTCFPTAGPLASWAGMWPGTHHSAGPQLSGHTRQGNV